MTTKRELQKQGFKAVTGFEPLYIDRTGKVYDFAQQRFLTISPKYRITYNRQALSIPKLILLVFDRQPYQNKRHVRFADGDKTNLHVQNLSYTVDRQKIAICHAELMKAVRCYFQVPKRYKTRNTFQTRLYLCEIARVRAFRSDVDGFEVFRTYIENPLHSKQRVAKMHGITITICTEIVNQCIKVLLCDVLHDLDCGMLQIIDYRPRKQTTAQILKQYNETSGRDPIRLPKKQTPEQLLSDWNKRIELMKNELKTPE